MWREIKKIIHGFHHFILTTHLNPDGDGIGAACALTELLMQMGKNVRFICDSPIPQKFAFLDYHGTFETYDPQKNYTCEVLIILDTCKHQRIGRLASLIDRPGILTVCIDHHEDLRIFTPYAAIDPQACSVGAMVYTLYKECGYGLNLRAASGIYTSVVCDTGRFCYSSTSRKAHKIADECIKIGVDPDYMYARLFKHVSLEETKMLARVLESMEIYLDNQVAIQIIRKEDCLQGDLEHIDLEYIHDFNNTIQDIQCFILLRELSNNTIRVSLRSKQNLDLSSVVHALGGGGHAHAAGLTWKGSLEEIKQRILTLLGELLNKREETIANNQPK